jgi:hypothetical protein
VKFAALHFGELGGDLAGAGSRLACNGLGLRVQSQAAHALAVGADSIVGCNLLASNQIWPGTEDAPNACQKAMRASANRLNRHRLWACCSQGQMGEDFDFRTAVAVLTGPWRYVHYRGARNCPQT